MSRERAVSIPRCRTSNCCSCPDTRGDPSGNRNLPQKPNDPQAWFQLPLSGINKLKALLTSEWNDNGVRHTALNPENRPNQG